MQFSVRSLCSGFVAIILVNFLFNLLLVAPSFAQSTYTAQLSGVVTDSSGGVIPGAKVTLTDEATGVGTTHTTDTGGIYVFTGVRPGTYAIRVEAHNLAAQGRKGLILAVSQQATLDFTLSPGVVSETITVTEQAPLLDTGNAALGTDVTSEYFRDMPLINRSMFGLVFLAGGVTETTGSGTQDSYPSGTNFVSNGQRNATAEIRLDGALTSAPEQGEGGTTNVYYQPSVEIVQEFKVENNSFSAEYGNNGGTVVNLVLKEGGNKFHGSGWWFGQRSALDANDFFNGSAGVAKPDHLRDQYGFSLGGPLRKQKTFFFVDLEFTREHDPVNMNGTVPTDDERNGIFTNSPQVIYNPFQITCDPPQPPTPPCSGTFTRAPFANNVIDPQYIDPIGQALLKLYPEPNVPGQPVFDNFRDSIVANAPSHQFDVKVDHHFNDKQRVAVRYSQSYGEYNVPFVLASGDFGDGQTSSTTVHNIGLEHNWNVTPTSVWTNRLALDRVYAPVNSNFPGFSAAGFPAILGTANGLKRMPTIQLDGANDWISMYTQCCTDTKFAHTLWTYSSALSWVKHSHTLKFGFEQRQFFNNFWQPDNPTGLFSFPQVNTADNPFDTSDLTKGSSFASLLVGFGAAGGSSFINIKPQVADKSMETAFYVQDDWKITPKLTINLGLRYEWSSPYTERFNRQQYSDFKGDTGMAVTLPDVSNPILNATPPNLATPTELMGTTLFVNQGGLGRSVPTDRNNIAPRVGFAWSIDSRTVFRGGAGLYYGLNPATNFQYPGAAFFAQDSVFFTTDNYQTRCATLENPFPPPGCTGQSQLGQPQGQKYGKLAQWGYGNGNNLGREEARNADIYQWNLGVQHLFPWEFTIGVDYSANRSTHLPWGGYSSTRNRNFIPSAELARISAQLHAQDATCDDPNDNCVTNYLSQLVDNPFAPLFVGSNAIFNEPSALYAQVDQFGNPQQIPLGYLLHPYPQFSGSFEGLPIFGANSWYNSLQVRFQKRMNHYFSVEGNYTYSKSMDNSSAGFNPFVGNLNNTSAGYPVGNPQQLDNLKKEWAVSANDATHRLVLATILQVPVGKGRWIGKDMNRFLDGVVGGWSISGIITKQSGQPLAVAMANSRLMDGNQRPNVVCNTLSSGISYHNAASTGNSILNASCFADPGDQVPGNAPRYFSQLRADGIHNVDLSFSKEFAIRESMKLQFRGEFFNFTNTPRFAFPDVGLFSGTFGQVTSTAPGSAPRHTQFGLRFEF